MFDALAWQSLDPPICGATGRQPAGRGELDEIADQACSDAAEGGQ